MRTETRYGVSSAEGETEFEWDLYRSGEQDIPEAARIEYGPDMSGGRGQCVIAETADPRSRDRNWERARMESGPGLGGVTGQCAIAGAAESWREQWGYASLRRTAFTARRWGSAGATEPRRRDGSGERDNTAAAARGTPRPRPSLLGTVLAARGYTALLAILWAHVMTLTVHCQEMNNNATDNGKQGSAP